MKMWSKKYGVGSMRTIFLVAILLTSYFLLLTPIFAHEDGENNTATIHMYDDRYDPQDITISVGETMIF